MEERAAADDLVFATRIGIERYDDAASAVADGYRPNPHDPGPTFHYMRQLDGHAEYVLDPARPEGLVYAHTPTGPLLLGAVFSIPKQSGAPTPGGSITHWHTHENICISLPVRAIAGLASPMGACPPATFNVTSPAMMHIWTIENPAGPFADELPPGFVARLAGSRT